MSLNLVQAWKDIPPPSPDVASPPPGRPTPGMQEGAVDGPVQAPTDGGSSPGVASPSPQESLPPVQSAQAAPQQADAPPPLHSLFERPLVPPPADAAWKPDAVRLQQLAALVLHRHEDPELDDILAKNPAWHAQASLDDGSMPARAMLGQQIAREVLGESHANEPGLYFLAVGEKLPQSATRQEAYAAICDHYARETEQRYVDNKHRRAAWQANRAALEKLIPQVVSGLKTPEELTAELTPAQLAVYNREFDPTAVGKAHAAFQLLRQAFSATPEEGLRSMIDQRLSRRITSCLSDAAQDGSAVLNETALELFEVSLKSLMADVQEQSGDQYKFLHNVRLALFSPLRKRGDDIRLLDATHQAAEQAGNAAIAAGIAEAIGWESGKQNAEARLEMKTDELAALREEWLCYRAADTQETRVLGLLSQGQDLGNQPSERASFTSRTVNCLGSVVGQTMPFFVPAAGWGIALAGAFDDKRNRAYYAGLEPGTAEWSAFIDAAASTAVEKISFGAIGKFSGAGWLINKLPAASKLRRTLSDALWRRVLFETGAGIVEETVAEPTAEAVIQWVVRNNLAPLVKLDAGGKYDWDNYWQELRGMLSPDQLTATALFVGGLSGMQAPSIRRSLITYSGNAEMLMTQGIPKEEAQRIAQIENASERIAAARQAREKAWGNYEQAVKNAREGMAAFRHLGEVQATLESEAYKYFQKQYNLPTVEEKLDAPGTYAVTVYDRDSGKKKFTQEMTGDQLVTLFGQYFSRAEQEEVRKTQSEFAANAFLRSAEASGELQTQDMFQWGRDHQENVHSSPPARTSSPASGQGPPTSSILPRTSSIVPQETSVSALGGFIRAFGAMSRQAFSHLARLATREYARRTASGMPEQEAASAPFSALSPFVPLGSLMELDKAFAHRLDIAKKTTGEEGFAATRLFRMGTAPGTTPADTLFLLARGNIGSRELLEDLFEWKLGKLASQDPARLQAIGSLMQETQASLQKLGFKGQFIVPKGELTDMQIIEAMSKLALSDMLANADALPLPQWQKDLLQYHVNTLGDAAYLLNLGQAYNAGRKAGTITQDMADILRDLGHEVHTVFDTAKIQQEDIRAVMDARAILASRDPSGAPTASQIRERQRQDEQEENNRVTTGDQGKRLTPPPSAPSAPPASGQSPQESKIVPRTSSLVHQPPSLVNRTSELLGVFANGASYNPDAGTWLGMVPVDKLHLSPEVPQVKVNSGKKGVVNPLVGDYRADAPPIYVWMRANGRLEVVSGRHRLDLAQRTGTRSIPAYVYEEDAAHNAQWARLLDYEQNMQDDQADELTAAIYVRETGLTDAELTRRGLTRSGTRSRRGLLIGREARQELWGRFKSGAISARDAEAICLITQHIQDKTRIDAIQAQAAADLAAGKSLDFAAAKIQLMIHAPQDGGMVQGLISFGASFDEALERSAEYVTRCIAVINEHIGAIKGVRTIAKKGTVMESEGITAGLSADPAQRLRELELLKAMYEKIGLYENLRFRALAWDGKTPPDPIGDHRLDMQAEQARAREEAAARQEEENRKASEALTPGLGFSLALRPSEIPWFPSLWKEAARELNSSGRVSFSLNGSRIAIHTLSEEKMRHALKLGGMPNPAVQIADLDSGPTHYGEIACILHPDRIDPAKIPGARIWRGDAWTRTMPEKITEDGDSWEDYEHSGDETAWFYDAEGELRKWTRQNLDSYMKAKHLYSFMPHDMTPDDVLDNYGDDGGAFPIIMASQAYAAEFPTLEEARRTDNLTSQLHLHEAEQAAKKLKEQFESLIRSYYFEPRSLQKFLMEYRHKDTTPETVLKALADAWMIDAPDSLYDVEENPEEYHDIESSNAYIAEEIADFLTACRASAQSYYEAAPGGWLSPSDFSGFILPSSLEETLRPELGKYGVPIHAYPLTEKEARLLDNPWSLAKSPWLKEEVDELRNAAIRDFLEDHDVSFSLFGEEEDSPSSSRDFPVPSARFPLALSPTRLAEAFHAVRQAAPVAAELPPADAQDGPQALSRLARQAYMALRVSTRMADLPHHPRARRAELAKPLLRLSDGRTAHLGKAGWKRFMASSPSLRSLAAMAQLPSLVDSALYLYSVPSFDNDSPEQNRAWHYYLGRVQDAVHGECYVLLSFREDTRGAFFDGLETAPQKDIDQIGNVSARPDSGFIHRAKNGGSLPGNTLHAIKAFVNFVDAHQAKSLAAPNGQPSRLTPDQWYLVRTAPFLDYFGDWLHSPASSSVVLDDNGEPRICYRGLKQTYNPGVSRLYTWVSASRELSASYAAGGPVLDLFVTARRPFRLPDGLTRQNPDHFREAVKKELARDQKKNILTQEQYRAAARKLDALLQGTQETEAFKLWERHRELKDILSSLGYDSVMTEENGVMTYGLFRPGQAKSALGNCGSYDITLRDITFSLSQDASQANIPDPPSSSVNRPSTAPLAALHSLSAERLLAADKLGGLPLPSIAVTRLDKPYTWGGEENIYLVGSPSLADPAQGVEIHDRDMWSGHFPELRWIPRARRQREEFYEQARQASLRYYGEGNISPLRFLKNALDGSHRGELESKLRKNDLSLALFALEQGYAPRPIMTKTLGRLHTGDRLFYADIRKMLEKDADFLNPDKQPDFCAAMQRAIERYRKQYSREEGLSVTQARIRKTNLRNMETELDKAQGEGFFDISWQALQDARYAGRPIPDWSANFKRFEKYAARHQKAHDAWVRDKLERWLNPVPHIKGAALKATLENFVEYMLESKRAGAERAVVFSTGLLRAKQSRRFHSLEEVKAARDTLVTTEENHASEQKAQDYIHRFQAALNEIDESFAAYDNAVEALSLVRGQPTRAKILAALARIYRGTSFRGRIARSSRLPDLGVMALVSLREELRDYFEGVPQRAVMLSEFSHAVLPASLRREKTVRDILRRHNIRPLYHDGTQQGRFQALSSLIGTSVSFSLHPGGSPQMSPIVPRPSASSQPETPSFSVIGPRAATWDQYAKRAFPGRDDGLPRAEMDASRSSLRDHAAPFRQALRRELGALRRSLPEETKAQIRRYLLLHRKFYLNKKTLEPEKHVPQWHEYLALSGEKETWTALLAPSLLRAGLCGGSLPFARQLSVGSLSLLVREDRAVIASLADRGLAETPLPLADRLDYPELYAAYPQLRHMPVVTELLDGLRGFYSPAERAIYLHRNMDAPQEIRSVLLHEVQHAIQHIEGFARGGAAEAARQFYESQRRAAAQALAAGRRFMDWLSARERMIAALKYMLSLARTPRRVLRTSYRYSYSDVSRRLTGEERILDMARYALADLSRLLEEFYDCNWNTAPEYELPWPYHYNLLTPSGIAQCLEDARKTPSRRQAFRRTPKPDLRALNSAWLKYERLSSLASHELYLRLAGEIEARNVQTRLDWHQSRRAAEPFNMTLDYPGEALVAFYPDASPANIPNRTSSILPRTSESFSLASLHDIVSSLAAPSMQATRAADLVKDFFKAAENWRRVMSGKEEQPAAPVGAELFGMVSSLISSARLVLPPGYRSRVDLQMQWASVYAAMAESGQIPPKGSLRSGDAFYERFVTAMVNNTLAAASAEDARQILASIGSQRLDRVMSSVLDRVRGQLACFAKDELYEKTMRRVEAVYPKKEPGKKSPRGRLEAQAYRLLARYRSMLASTPEVKAQAMASLNALHNGEPDADKRREYEEELLAWKTYGDYAGMSLPQAQAAMKQLLEFVMTGRSAWTAKLRQERGRAKYAARQIGRNLPAANNASSRAGGKIAYRTRLRKCLASLPYGFMSYSHLMLALEPVLGQRFSRERIREIAEANAALLNASNDRAAWLSAAIRRITGAKSESAAEQWLVEFNTPQETGIILKPAITVQITLPVEEARDWLALTKEERAARRKEIRKNDAIAETLTENVPEEEDIPLLRQALDDYESRTPDQQQYQRFLTTEREIEGEENAFPLTCSRDCALYAILLHEQEDYADKYDEDGKLIRKGFLSREGFDEAAMAALYEFVGPAGLEYGYALREKLNETGQTLARVYEERMGVPFALKENYFRATFDRNSTREKDALAGPQGGAIATGKYGSLIERIPHAENLDFSRAASLVFLAAAAEQDNYIHTSHITAFWRSLLLDKRLEQKLRQNLGEDLMGKLASWLDLIDGASLENNRAFLHLSRMQGMLQRAFAFSVLAGNGYVLLKQSTAILHGFFAGWAPSGVLERADGSHELAHRHISFSSFIFHLAASNMGLGEISLKEVAQTPYFTARMRGEGAILAQIASQMPGQRYSRLEKPAEKLMNLIETVDVKANLHAMHALANAYYARALQMNREHGNPFTEAQLRAAALEQVGLSLELGAQPLTKTQKSMNQAAGGILSRLAYVMKSEQLNKLGLMAAQWKTGSARNRVCAVQSWLSLGVASSLLAWFIAWLKGQEEDEDEEKKWRKYGATALLGDLTSIPLAGEGVNYLASLFTGQRVFADNYARTLIDVGAITRSLKKEYEHLAQKKEMDWDAHFNNLTALVRAAGVGGAFSRSPSAVLSGYGALSLSAASGANLTRTSKDLLTALFTPPKRERNKKRGE